MAVAVSFIVFLELWSLGVHTTKEKLLETLGTHQSTLLLALTAALTCVIAPVCVIVLAPAVLPVASFPSKIEPVRLAP